MHYTLDFIAQSFADGVLECNGMLNDDFTQIIAYSRDIKWYQNSLLPSITSNTSTCSLGNIASILDLKTVPCTSPLAKTLILMADEECELV